MKNFGSRHRSSQGVLANRTVATIAVITAASIAKSITISTGLREFLGNFDIDATGSGSSPS